jgi:hypothetical protein
MTTGKPGLPVSERTLRALGLRRPSPAFHESSVAKKGRYKFWRSASRCSPFHLISCFHPSLLPPMPSKHSFRVHISSTAPENVSPLPPTIMTFALPSSAAEDLLRRAPAPKPQTAYNIVKSRLSTWNLNTPNPGEKCDGISTSFASAGGFLSDAMVLDVATGQEGYIVNDVVDRDRWMATEPPGPFSP